MKVIHEDLSAPNLTLWRLGSGEWKKKKRKKVKTSHENRTCLVLLTGCPITYQVCIHLYVCYTWVCTQHISYQRSVMWSLGEIQGFKIWVALTQAFQGHSKSNLMVQLYSSYMISCWCIISNIYTHRSSFSSYTHLTSRISYHWAKNFGPLHPPLIRDEEKGTHLSLAIP